MRTLLEENERLQLYQGMVEALRIRGGRVSGISCADGSEFLSERVVLTAGTFLRGRIKMGVSLSIAAGRAGDPPSVSLAEQLLDLGLSAERFKTGTPPRVDGRTVDFTKLTRQESEPEPLRFSHWENTGGLARMPCWIGAAGAGVREVVEANLGESAMYGGAIASRGPRYCPSIEDKVKKFPEAESHQLFLEPEGLETRELYVNGLSTSLPPDVQRELLGRVSGLEHARMTQPGYAIEYDFFPPQQLEPTLELKVLRGLYFAGQINGTTGYEEAAGQGIVAGINAGLAALEREAWVPGRDEAYLGVLVDDLVTRGVDEPYRLFTSRAEFRLTLRQDNCLERLGPVGERLGTLTEDEIARLDRFLAELGRARTWARTTSLEPKEVNGHLQACGTSPLSQKQPLRVLLKRPQVRLEELVGSDGPLESNGFDSDVLALVEMEVKYEGYLGRERDRVEALRRQEGMSLPAAAPYLEMGSLSVEGRQKLERVQPRTLGQAGRIPGVSPADLQNLLVELRRRELSMTGVDLDEKEAQRS
jgi:tRNA uridine 5-carboxymethylaminomethyl modification enzyme